MDLFLLDLLIRRKGLNRYKMSQLMHMPHSTFRDKMEGRSEFKASEIRKIRMILSLDNDTMCKILFSDGDYI